MRRGRCTDVEMSCRETTHGPPTPPRRHRTNTVSCCRPDTHIPTRPQSASGTYGLPPSPPATPTTYRRTHRIVPTHVIHRLLWPLELAGIRPHHAFVLLLGHLVDAQVKRLGDPYSMLLLQTSLVLLVAGEPIWNSPAGISTSFMPMEFVIVTGSPNFSAAACCSGDTFCCGAVGGSAVAGSGGAVGCSGLGPAIGSSSLAGLAGPAAGTRATRKPRSRPRNPGQLPQRDADWQSLPPEHQPPPRVTRNESVVGPIGSPPLPSHTSPYQSWHHSHTFPCMSYNPKVFGFFSPTGCGLSPEFALYQAYSPSCFSSSPKQNLPVLPARQAYSHCDSVGNTNLPPLPA